MELHPSITNIRSIKRFKTLEEDCRAVHGDLYDYTNVVYKATRDKVDIHCKACDLPFTMKVNAHLNGQGCPTCGVKRRADFRRKPTQLFVDQAISIHGTKYDYSDINYVNDSIHLSVKCNKHQTHFSVTVNNHLNKQSGCPYCWEVERQLQSTIRDTCLYYVRINNKTKLPIYKIGITTRSLARRFTGEGFYGNFEVLFQTPYGDRQQAVELEQQILIQFKEVLLSPATPVLIPKNGGDNELFSKDIFSEFALPNNCSLDTIKQKLTELK